MGPLLLEIERRWQLMFAELAAGGDLPPGTRLRTEGLMEAAVLLELSDEGALLEKMDTCYAAVNGKSLAAALGEDWRTLFPFPQIPAMAQRAPVYPSTRD